MASFAVPDASDRPMADDATSPGSPEELLRIGEIARQYGITLRTLRFYEDKGLLKPTRDGSMRLYSRRDISRLRLILLGRRVGFSLREVKQMMDLYDPAGTNAKQLRVALEKGERQLKRLEKQQQLVEESILELTTAIGVVRQKLADRQPPAGMAN